MVLPGVYINEKKDRQSYTMITAPKPTIISRTTREEWFESSRHWT